MLYKGEAARDNPAVLSEAVVAYQVETQPLFGDANEETEKSSITAGSQQRGGGATPIGAAADSAEAPARAAADSQKVVYLTFDDGPSKRTPEVLDILKKEGIKATFFVLGEQVERNPKLAKRMIEEGHSIGNHTYDHKYERLYGSFSGFVEQVIKTDNAIFNATGIRTTLLRAPGGTHGNFDQGYFDALEASGYRVHDWNVDSGDSKRIGVPAADIVNTIKHSKLADTLNVLLHDGVGHEESVKALPSIIHYYKKLGYRFETLSEEVQPMQFRLASKSKWSRGPVTEEQTEPLVRFGASLDRSGARQAVSLQEPDLTVHWGDEQIVFDAGSYRLLNGSIHVSLKPFAQWLGGEAELDESTGVVEATLLGKKLFWMADAPPANVSGETDGQAEEGGIDVPLRATLGELGVAVKDYVYSKERREVWLE